VADSKTLTEGKIAKRAISAPVPRLIVMRVVNAKRGARATKNGPRGGPFFVVASRYIVSSRAWGGTARLAFDRSGAIATGVAQRT